MHHRLTRTVTIAAVAATGLLVVSCFVGVRVVWLTGGFHEYGVYLGRGAVRAAVTDRARFVSPGTPGLRAEWGGVVTPPSRIELLPTAGSTGAGVSAGGTWSGVLPLWPGVAVLGAWAAWRRRREAQRRAEGRCVDCGYVLNGQPAGVCPECGRGGGATAGARAG